MELDQRGKNNLKSLESVDYIDQVLDESNEIDRGRIRLNRSKGKPESSVKRDRLMTKENRDTSCLNPSHSLPSTSTGAWGPHWQPGPATAAICMQNASLAHPHPYHRAESQSHIAACGPDPALSPVTGCAMGSPEASSGSCAPVHCQPPPVTSLHRSSASAHGQTGSLPLLVPLQVDPALLLAQLSLISMCMQPALPLHWHLQPAPAAQCVLTTSSGHHRRLPWPLAMGLTGTVEDPKYPCSH
ncbi:hypothetical protein CB1_002238002 [Camelus ferus]|nr:hypothetical protein CB1_002238002 [Camelus ferus]